MRSQPNEALELGRIMLGRMKSSPGEICGAFKVTGPHGRKLQIIASDGEGVYPWEHVSVSVYNKVRKTPTWAEMAFVKDLFWKPDEVVVQYHPAKADYVNVHPGVLHLWRPTDVEIPMPPLELV